MIIADLFLCLGVECAEHDPGQRPCSWQRIDAPCPGCASEYMDPRTPLALPTGGHPESVQDIFDLINSGGEVVEYKLVELVRGGAPRWFWRCEG